MLHYDYECELAALYQTNSDAWIVPEIAAQNQQPCYRGSRLRAHIFRCSYSSKSLAHRSNPTRSSHASSASTHACLAMHCHRWLVRPVHTSVKRTNDRHFLEKLHGMQFTSKSHSHKSHFSGICGSDTRTAECTWSDGAPSQSYRSIPRHSRFGRSRAWRSWCQRTMRHIDSPTRTCCRISGTLRWLDRRTRWLAPYDDDDGARARAWAMER